MSFDEFFTDGDKPYAENLNDSLALIDAFDVTVPAEMPTMFSNGEFNSTVNVTRKCGVALVTLKSVGSGVTVGTSSISGTGDVVFRVYPNFNSFYKWSKIILEKSGTVSIAFYKTDGTEISATVGADGTISENSALKQLQEIDVVLTLSNASISNVLIEFINNQTERTRTGALLEASQLVNVNGTVTANDGKAVSGDTVKSAFDSFESDVVDEKLEDLGDLKEDIANKVTSLDNSDTHYPSSKAVKTVTDALNSNKENASNKVTTLDNSNTHYPSCTAVNGGLNTKANTSHTHPSSDITDLLNVIYPVGCIYMSITNSHPNVGTWVQIKDTFLLACGNTYASDGDKSTAQHGEAAHTLTTAEMPSHNHGEKVLYGKMRTIVWNGTENPEGICSYNTNNTNDRSLQSGSGCGSQSFNVNATHTHDNNGGGQAHNNMPPYMAVYVFKRTA